MQNEFTSETRKLFDNGGWMMSWETGMNNANCLHHIMGRISDSPYNAAPLNNKNDHQPEGRKGLPPLSSQIVRSKYLKKTMRHLNNLDYKPNDKDKAFLEKHKEYYN